MARTPPDTTPDQLSLEDCTDSRSARAQRRINGAERAPRVASITRHRSYSRLRMRSSRERTCGTRARTRAVDAVFRILPVVALPGYSRPMIRAQEYLALIARNTYNGDRVRP